MQEYENNNEQALAANDAADGEGDLNHFFVSEKWHRVYAEALLETDPAKLCAIIAEAERAIFARYLQLCTSSCSIEQSHDLEQATGVLS